LFSLFLDRSNKNVVLLAFVSKTRSRSRDPPTSMNGFSSRVGSLGNPAPLFERKFFEKCDGLNKLLNTHI
jgi:hypothetical protein